MLCVIYLDYVRTLDALNSCVLPILRNFIFGAGSPYDRQLSVAAMFSFCVMLRRSWILAGTAQINNTDQSATRTVLGRAHVPPTKVFRRVAVNKTILKPRLAAATGGQYVYVGFSWRNKIQRSIAYTISEKAIRFWQPDYNPDRAQTLNSSSMSRHLSTCNISSKSMHAFSSNLANKQTDRQTDKHGQKHLLRPLSEVKYTTS